MTAKTPAPSDELILVAVERAHRQRPVDSPGVPRREVVAHLGLTGNRSASVQVRDALERLAEQGLLKGRRWHGSQLWELTPAARQRLQEPVCLEAVALLPESPQHRAWREARVLAREEIGRFREELRVALEQSVAMLDAEESPDSDAWFERTEEIFGLCRRLGSAVYWLSEWPEPSEQHADIDQHESPTDLGCTEEELRVRRARRVGRRAVFLWR